MKQAVLAYLKNAKRVHLDRVSEPMRDCLIDLGVAEPPLVDTDGPWVFMTEAGFRACCNQTPAKPSSSSDSLRYWVEHARDNPWRGDQ